MRNALKSKRALALIATGTILLGILLVSVVQAQRPVPPTPPPPPPLPTLTPQLIPGMPIPTSTPNILVEPQLKVGPPEFTPTPYINTVDLAPKMSMKDKVEIWILTADGEKKRFIAPPEVRPESLLESGDTLLVVVPPASSRRVPPGPPTQLPGLPYLP